MRKRAVWGAVAITALAGCAGAGYSWVPMPGNSGSFAQADARCDYETSSSTQGTDYRYRTVFGQELDRALRKSDLYEKCMRVQGFQKVSNSISQTPANPKWKILEDDWAASKERRQQLRVQLTSNPTTANAEEVRAEIQSLNVRVRELERKLSYAPSQPVSTD